MSFPIAYQEDSFRALQDDLVRQHADVTIAQSWLNVEIFGGSAPQASDRSKGHWGEMRSILGRRKLFATLKRGTAI